MQLRALLPMSERSVTLKRRVGAIHFAIYFLITISAILITGGTTLHTLLISRWEIIHGKQTPHGHLPALLISFTCTARVLWITAHLLQALTSWVWDTTRATLRLPLGVQRCGWICSKGRIT